jgi:hypothetical protein
VSNSTASSIVGALVEQAKANLPAGRMRTLAYDKAADDAATGPAGFARQAMAAQAAQRSKRPGALPPLTPLRCLRGSDHQGPTPIASERP